MVYDSYHYLYHFRFPVDDDCSTPFSWLQLYLQTLTFLPSFGLLLREFGQ